MILVIIIIIGIIVASIFLKSTPDNLNLNDLNTYLNQGKINSVTIQSSSSQVILKGTYVDGNNHLHAFIMKGISPYNLEELAKGNLDSPQTALLNQIVNNSGNIFQGYSNIPVDQTAAIVGTIVPLIVMIVIYVLLF